MLFIMKLITQINIFKLLVYTSKDNTNLVEVNMEIVDTVIFRALSEIRGK